MSFTGDKKDLKHKDFSTHATSGTYIYLNFLYFALH